MFGLPPIVGTIAYHWIRVPLKQRQTQRALRQLGTDITADLAKELKIKYGRRDFILPLALMCTFAAFTYAIAYPYFIQLGLWAGLLPEIINLFGADAVFPRAILIGHVMFYGWLGAYTYGFMIIGRRFLSYDLTPAVYFFVTIRFGLAYIVGAVVGGAVGHFGIRAGLPLDTALGLAAVTCFFIGFFPEQGVNWIAATARKVLKQRGRLSTEISLAAVQGLSIWQQSRLQQEDVENAQNLATADLPLLIINTPVTLAQLTDWIDQSILLVCASQTQAAALKEVGIRTASDLLLVARTDPHLNQLSSACGLKPDGLQVLSIAIRATSNMKDILHLRDQFNVETSSVLAPLPSMAAFDANLKDAEVSMAQ